MNVKEFAGVDIYYRDLKTGQEVEWHEYMSRVVSKIGIENIKPFLPTDLETIKEKLKKDPHLNNIPLRLWDRSAECIRPLLISNGITTHSLSDRVCILKETARILCEKK